MNLVRFQGENPNVYYEFDRDSAPLGEGGMGRVYSGYRIDSVLNYQSLVAIKCIRQELISNPTIIQRAQREASVRVDHPNLIRMYGFFNGAEISPYTGTYVPMYYLAMERLIGVNLDEILFQGVTSDRSGVVVPIADELRRAYSQDRESAAISVLMSILMGVGYLHQNGFIHRDLDPSNIMFTHTGDIKIIDFGICKRIGMTSLGESSGLTQAGQFLGKVAYAAPELILGDLDSQGPPTDIYALGVMLYQMVSGHLPVDGRDQEVMEAHLKGKLNYAEISNKKLRKIIETATDKDLSRRFQTAGEFSSALESLKTSVHSHSGSSSGQTFEKQTTNIPDYILPLSGGIGLIAGIAASLLL